MHGKVKPRRMVASAPHLRLARQRVYLGFTEAPASGLPRVLCPANGTPQTAVQYRGSHQASGNSRTWDQGTPGRAS